MKHLNLLCLVSTAFLFLFPLVANAQTPVVKKLTQNSLTSFTAYGTITGNTAQNENTNCHIFTEPIPIYCTKAPHRNK